MRLPGALGFASCALLLALASAAFAQPVHEFCSACHTSQVEDFQTHKHAAVKLSCDACHGPSVQHRESQGDAAPDKVAGPADQAALCGACHTSQAKEYTASKHGQLVAARSEKRAATCAICHGQHAPRQPAAIEAQCKRCHEQLPASCTKPPPAATAKVSCANCHDKHTLTAKK